MSEKPRPIISYGTIFKDTTVRDEFDAIGQEADAYETLQRVIGHWTDKEEDHEISTLAVKHTR